MDPPNCTIIVPFVSNESHVIFRLHTQRLAAKSDFLSGLFDGLSPRDILIPSRLPLRMPRSRLPRLLPSPPSHPILFLPVPDPSSIQSLFHWIYSGNTDHLKNALDHGHIHWQGLARNVEYLALPTDIKVFLGRWYRHWCLPLSDHLDDDNNDDDDRHRGRSHVVKPLVQLYQPPRRLCTS